MAKRVWNAFWQLDATRGSAGFGPLAITFLEIQAWQAVSGVQLQTWEIKAIADMDRARLAVANPPVLAPQQAASAEVFDAVFG